MPRDGDPFNDFLLRQIVEKGDDAVLITRAAPKEGSGREIIYVNPAFERLFGYTAAEAVARTPRILEGPRTDPATRARLRAAMDGRRQVRESILNYTKQGKEIWVDVNMVPLSDPSGEVAYFAAIERDITGERQLLERTLAGSLQLVMEVLSTYDPVTFKDSLPVRRLAVRLGEVVGVKSAWELDIASTLFMVGAISVPRSVMHNWQEHQVLDEIETEMVERIPEVGAKLLAAVPRLSGVAQTVRYQNKRFDGGGFPPDGVKGSDIPFNARVLALAKAFIREIGAGDTPKHIVDSFGRDTGRFDPDVLEKSAKTLRDFDTAARGAGEVIEVEPQNLLNGDELIDRIVTAEGTVLLGAGFVLTEAILTKLRHIRRTTALQGPIRVRRR